MKKFANLSKTTKILTVAIALTVLAGISVFAYKSINKNSSAPINPETGINYNPPTEQEQKAAEDHKAEVDKRAELEKNNANTQSSQKKQVSVVITSATINGIYSYVSGVFEDGGICTATITQDNKKITKTSSAFKDATYTACAPINLSRSDFPSAGTWTARVSYSSSASEGQSQSVNIEVQ